MNTLKLVAIIIMLVWGREAAFCADGNIRTNTGPSYPIVVARSRSFDGLHVELRHFQEKGGCGPNGMILAEIYRDNTNSIHFTDLIVPASGQAMLLSIKDYSGKVVSPREGSQFHPLPATLALSLNGWLNHRIRLCPHQLDWFCLDNLYIIKHTGDYELEAAPRFYRWTGPLSGPLPLITNFPSVKIRLHLNRNDLGIEN